MSILAQLKSAKEKVTHLLITKKRLRDDDEALVANIWHNEIMDLGFDSKTMTASQFLEMYAAGKLTTADAITRARRLVQYTKPELRGEKYGERQKEEESVRENIHELK